MSVVSKYLVAIGGMVLLVFILTFSLRQKPDDKVFLEEREILGEIPLGQATSSQPAVEKNNLPESLAVKAVIPAVPKEQIVIPPKIVPKAETSKEMIAAPKSVEPKPEVIEKSLPPLDMKTIMSAVVKIQCPTEDGSGKYIGSGFVLNEGTVVTAAHVVKDSGDKTCDIIFSKDRRPIHYLRGTLENLQGITKRHDEEGIDVAILTLPSLDEYPEARAIFSEYPKIPYPVCANPQMLGDKLLHFGYPSNYVDQNYLSHLEGEAVAYADINGIKEQLSADSTFIFKTPIFSYTQEESIMHPYTVSRVASFYGDSGGLAFNATKQCILGPHRGGTIGKGAGENYSIFMNIGWSRVGAFLPAN